MRAWYPLGGYDPDPGDPDEPTSWQRLEISDTWKTYGLPPRCRLVGLAYDLQASGGQAAFTDPSDGYARLVVNGRTYWLALPVVAVDTDRIHGSVALDLPVEEGEWRIYAPGIGGGGPAVWMYGCFQTEDPA